MMTNWQDEFLRLFSSGRQADVHSAFELKDKNLPRRLFKFFRPNQNAFNSMRDGMLWLASPSTFNDPFDSGLTFDAAPVLETLAGQSDGVAELEARGISRSDIAALMGGSTDPETLERVVLASPVEERDDFRKLLAHLPGIVKKLVEQHAKPLSRIFQEGLKVTCFTEQATSLLHWAHYADEHRGFCAEYSPILIPKDVPQRRLLFPVFYKAERFDVGPVFQQVAGGTLEVPVHAIVAALHKSVDWAYEKEWRIVHPDGAPSPGLLVPMIKPLALYAGARMSAQDRDVLAQVCADLKIPLGMASISETKYEVSLGPRTPRAAVR